MRNREQEWLWGWDATAGIVSVWAELDGQASVWRRVDGALVHERVRFRPWLLLDHLEDLAHLGDQLRHEADGPAPYTYRLLEGDGALRYRISAADGHALTSAVKHGAARRLGRPVSHLKQLGDDHVLCLPAEEQYLTESGRTYFGQLPFDALVRMQFDLETSGLDPNRDRIFLIAVRDHRGEASLLEATGEDDRAEAELLQRFVTLVQKLDPDVIENHNLHGFDLPFLVRRAERLGVTLPLGRGRRACPVRRPAARGAVFEHDSSGRGEQWRRVRFTVPGRELIDSMDAVRRYDFAARELPGHGLKAVARHLGVAREQRELIAGERIAQTYREDPERVRRYARDDVHEAAAVARLLGGAAFALARMVPRRYERLADAGAATGVLDPLLVRAYLREGAALPAYGSSDGTEHSGAALHLFATGVAQRVVKADVASLYPSLMRHYRIGPARDHLGVLVALVGQLVDQRLLAKRRARELAVGCAERHTQEALSAAMKLVVNSAYGYLGAAGLTRFSDVHAANQVTARGRALLGQMCRELAERGVTLLEADTDGVYFAVPEQHSVEDEARIVNEVAALLPSSIKLEFEGRYAAMLSHEPKNYALLGYDGALELRGVAFRSSRAEPFGERFLREALAHLLRGASAPVREQYVHAVDQLRRRALPTFDVSARVRLSKTPEEYRRTGRRELMYEALLTAGHTHWRPGQRVHVYRAQGGKAGLLLDPGEPHAPRDYDAEHYVRLLRDTFAARLARALPSDAFESLTADPQQPSLFASALSQVRPILTRLAQPLQPSSG